MGLGKISTKMCAQLHVFSLWRLTLVFDGTYKNFHKKSVPSHTFLRCGDYLKFLMGLGKFRQKVWPVTRFFSLWRLTWVFDGTWKTFHKKVCPVTRFVRYGDYLNFWMGLRKVSTKMCAQLHVLFAVETILTFGWDLEKFWQKSVPSHTFLRCGDNLEFWMGL